MVAGLSPEQKREYGLGWLNWLGAESIGVVVALLNIVWVPVVAFANIAVPDRILTVPILAAFAVSVAHFAALYRLRVRATPTQMLGAVCAAMSVQWTVARAVGIGVFKEHLPFLRTSKGGNSRKGPDFPAFWEAVIAALLLIGAVTLVVTNYKEVREINLRFRARGAEPAVPLRRRHGSDRRQPAELLRLLARSRGPSRALRRIPAALEGHFRRDRRAAEAAGGKSRRSRTVACTQ